MQSEEFMKSEIHNPDDYEQLYLLNIESQNKMAVFEVEKICERIRQKSVTSQDLRDIINSLNLYSTYFLSYEPIAQRLLKLGKPQLSERLNEILFDIRDTSKIFRDIVETMSENNSEKINKDKKYVTKATKEDIK